MKKLKRTSKDKRIMGVCGGIAQYIGMQSAILRLICLALGIIFIIALRIIPGMFLAAGFYCALAYIIPSDDEKPREKMPKKQRKFMLYRLSSERMISGCCAGLGDMLDVDPTLIRVGLIIPVFMTGIIPGVIFYLLYSWVVPEKKDIVFPEDKVVEVKAEVVSTPAAVN